MRTRDLLGYQNIRLSLLAATSSVPILAFLLQALFYEHGFVPPRTIQDIVDLCTPGNAPDLGSFLLRLPFRSPASAATGRDAAAQAELVRRLSTLVSNKGADVLLLSNSEPLPAFHRLRTSVPSQLWRWRTICSWHWRRPGCHINYLELSAFLTTIKWRVVQEGLTDKKIFT